MGGEGSWTPDRGKKWRRDYGEGHNIDESLDSADGAGSSDGDGAAPRSSPPHPSHPKPTSSWPVVLYVPNLLGYARIFLSFLGLEHALRRHRNQALNAWVAASILDLFDGAAARKLNQCSRFGTLLDIAADNVLRTTVWVAAIVESARSQSSGGKDECIMLGVAIVCLEWITMFCSQEGNQMHWKEVNCNQGSAERRRVPPSWVRAVFQNNFRSPLGVFAIFGLFVAPLGTYVWLADRSSKSSWPWLVLSEEGASRLIWAACAGRLLSASVELWLCYDYLRKVIAKDARPRARRKEEKLN